MADRRRRSPEGSVRTDRTERTRREPRASVYDDPIQAEPRRMRSNDAEEYMYSTSGSSSSYLDISRSFPPNKTGILSFFTAPSERRRLRKRRSSRGLFRIGNSSSSSVNSDLAYGTGFIKKSKRSVRSRKGKDIDRERYNEREREKYRDGDRHSDRERSGSGSGRRPGSGIGKPTTDAEILAVGAGLARLARKQNKLDLKNARNGRKPEAAAARDTSHGQYGASRGLGPSRVSHDGDEDFDDEWEYVSDSESESSVNSALAFDNYNNRSKWKHFFGRRKYKPKSKKSSVVDPKLFGPQNSLHGVLEGPVGFGDVSWNSSSDFGQRSTFSLGTFENASASQSQQSLTKVEPIAAEDTTRYEAGRGSLVSGQYNPRPGPPFGVDPRYETGRGSFIQDQYSSTRPGPPPGADPRYDAGRGSFIQNQYSSTRPGPPPARDSSRYQDIGRESVVEDKYSSPRPGPVLDSSRYPVIGRESSIPGPTTISDPSRYQEPSRPQEQYRFQDARDSSFSGPETYISRRPDPIPIQQPQPYTPVSQSVFEPAYAARSESGAVLKQAASSTPRTSSLAQAALVGVTGAMAGAAIASSRGDRKDRRREEELEELERERLRRLEREKKEYRDSPQREKRSSPDRSEKKEKTREKDKRDDSDEKRRERKREKRREDSCDDKEDRREKRREERRNERSEFEPRTTESVVSAPTPTKSVDPFLYQVKDDASPTPKGGPSETQRQVPSVPSIVTVEREPDFTRRRSYPVKERSEYEPRKDSFPLEDKERREREERDRPLHKAEEFYDDARHSTAPYDAAIMTSAIAAVVTAEEERKSRAEKRQDERRGEGGGEFDDYSGKPRDSASQKERDTVQEEADRYYREVVMARKITSEIIRQRSPSPNRSVIDKYEDDEEEEPVHIVTPPEMADHKEKGPFDAPNADFRPDYEWKSPMEVNIFSIPEIREMSSLPPGTLPKRDPDADKPRPFLNLVRPTPKSSPAPEKQAARSEPVRRRSKSRDREQPKRVSASEVAAIAAERERSTKSPVADVVIGPKENVVPAPPPTLSTASKAVTWGENETKHYDVESPSDQREVFVSNTEVPFREVPEEIKQGSSSKTRGWGALAGVMMGISAGAAVAAASDSSKASKSKDEEKKSESAYEYRGVAVEPDSPPRSWKSSPPRDQRQPSPPAPGPKPTASQTSHMPGAFDDDLEFTAAVAAGLQDTGFNPDIVINNPTFRRRESPPGSNDHPIYQSPFAETVSDLGIARSEIRGTQGSVIDEVASTPRDWQSISPSREVETPTKLSMKEREKRDKERRQSGNVTPLDVTTVSREVVEEPESYFVEPKLSKKEQKKRDKEIQRQRELAEDVSPSIKPSIAEQIVAEPESYVETPKKSKKLKNGARSSYDEAPEEFSRDGRSYTVPVDAFADSRNKDNDWTTETKKSKKSKRDSDQYDSPIRSAPTSVPTSEVGVDDRSSSKKSKRDSSHYDSPARSVPTSEVSIDEKSSSKSKRDNSRYDSPARSEVASDIGSIRKSKEKPKRRGESYDVDPTEVSLPPSTPSESSVDDARRTRKSLDRDSGIFSSADRGDSRSVVSTSASRYDDDEPRKSKKKHRSSTKDDFDDTRSVASAPASEGWDDSKKGKRKDKEKDNEKEKEKKSSGFFGLFGSKSESAARDESPKQSKGDAEDKKKKKSKRSSTSDASSLYGGTGSGSVGDLSRSISNGKSNGNGLHHDYDQYEDGTRSDGEGKSKKSRSRSESTSSKKDSFLGNAGILGAGVGIAGAAVATAQQYRQPKAANTNDSEITESSRSMDLEQPSEREDAPDPEIQHRVFRPSIDPQYGDLLPLPPSAPNSPNAEPVDELPGLPDSRPETPEEDRVVRDRAMSAISSFRKNQFETPIKSPSQSAVPVRFLLGNRSNPTSPIPLRSSPISSPPIPNQDPPTFPKYKSRPTSWEASTEFRPLYLVESHRRGSVPQLTEAEEAALPPSQATSRSSSFHDFGGNLNRESDGYDEKNPLSIDTALARSASPTVLLGSEQSTPKAAFHDQDVEIGADPMETPKWIDDDYNLPSRRREGSSSPEKSERSHTVGDIAASVAVGGLAAAASQLFRSAMIKKASKSGDTQSTELRSSPADPGAEDRSLDPASSPIPQKFDNMDTESAISQPNASSSARDALSSIEEQGADISEEVSAPQEIQRERETVLGSLSGAQIPQDEPIEVARSITEAEPIDDVAFTTPKKSKKDRKKSKGLSRSSTKDDIATIAETSKDTPQESSAVVEREPIEETPVKSKAENKKNREKDKPSMAWDDTKDVQQQLEASETLPKPNQVPRSIFPNQTGPVEKVLESKDGLESKSIAPLEPETQNEDETDEFHDALDESNQVRQGSISASLETTPFETPLEKQQTAEIFVPTSTSQKDKKKDKKKSRSVSLGPDEPVTQVVPEIPTESPEEALGDAPAPLEESAEELPLSKFKKSKKEKRKSKSTAWDTAEPADDRPTSEAGREIVANVPANLEPLDASEKPALEDFLGPRSSKKDRKNRNSQPTFMPEQEASIEPAVIETSREIAEECAFVHDETVIPEPQLDHQEFTGPTLEQDTVPQEPLPIEVQGLASAEANQNLAQDVKPEEPLIETETLDKVVEPVEQLPSRPTEDLTPEFQPASEQGPGQGMPTPGELTGFESKKSKKKKRKSVVSLESEKDQVTAEASKTIEEKENKEIMAEPVAAEELVTKRGKKRGNSTQIEDPVRELSPVPILQEADDTDISVRSLSKMDKEKGKKSQSPDWEETSVEIPVEQTIIQNELAESAENPADDTPVDKDIESFIPPGSKQGKKKLKKSQRAELEPETSIHPVIPPETEKEVEADAIVSPEPLEDPSTSKKGKKKSKKSQSSEVKSESSSADHVATLGTEKNIEVEGSAEVEPIEELTSSKKGKKKQKKSQILAFEPDSKTPVGQGVAVDKSNRESELAESFEEPTLSKKGKKKSRKSEFAEVIEAPPSTTTNDELGITHSENFVPGSEMAAGGLGSWPIASAAPGVGGEAQDSSSKRYSPGPAALLPVAAVGAALLQTQSSKKDSINADESMPSDTTSSKHLATAQSGTRTDDVETRDFTPDGLKAGYKDEQLSLARQLQEEFAGGSKKSKRDKKKRQSLPSTPDRLPSRSRAVENLVEDHHRARSLSIGPSGDRSGESPANAERKTIYSEDQLEFARQLKAEFDNKKSKKEKKGRKGRSLTQDDNVTNQDSQELQGVNMEATDTPQPELLESASKGDGFAAGYQEEQLSLARQLQEEFGSGSKKSKKDKKRRGTSQTPLEQEPVENYLGEQYQSAEPREIGESENIIAPAIMEETKPARDGLAVGYNEDQLELARQLKEEFAAKKSKKDKKEKKRQSLLRGNTDDDLASNALPRDYEASDAPTPTENAEQSSSTLPAGPEDEFPTVEEKSRKDKKAKTRGSLLRDPTDDGLTASRNIEVGEETVPQDIIEQTVSERTVPLPEGDFVPTKESKKEKRGKQRDSVVQGDAQEAPTSNIVTPAVDETVEPKLLDQALEIVPVEAEDEFASTEKKKKSKKRASFVPERDYESSSAITTTDADNCIEQVPITEESSARDLSSSEVPIPLATSLQDLESSRTDIGEFPLAKSESEFPASTKKSKRDKKSKKRDSVGPDSSADVVGDNTSQDLPETSSANLEFETPSVAKDNFDSPTRKDKKKRQSSVAQEELSAQPEDDAVPSEIVPTPEPSTDIAATGSAAEAIDEPSDDLGLSKKSKKDKKKRQSLLRSSTTEVEPESPPQTEQTTVEPDSRELGLVEPTPSAPIEASQNQSFEPSGKQSKKDKKKRKSLQQTALAEEAAKDNGDLTSKEPDPWLDLVIPEPLSQQPILDQPTTLDEPNLGGENMSENLFGDYALSKKSSKDKQKPKDSSAEASGYSTPLDPLSHPVNIPLPAENSIEKSITAEPLERIPEKAASAENDVPIPASDERASLSRKNSKKGKAKNRNASKVSFDEPSASSTPLEAISQLILPAFSTEPTAVEQPQERDIQDSVAPAIHKEPTEEPLVAEREPTKKSKKDKKRKGSSKLSLEEVPSEPIRELAFPTELELVEQAQGIEAGSYDESITQELTEESLEASDPTKKSKEDKMSRKDSSKTGLDASNVLSESVLEATKVIIPSLSTESTAFEQPQEGKIESDSISPAEEVTDEELAPTKKEKTEEKRRESSQFILGKPTLEPSSASFAESQIHQDPAEQNPPREIVEQEQEPVVPKAVPEEPREDFTLSRKNSKKVKKSRKGSTFVDFDEPADISEPQTTQETAKSSQSKDAADPAPLPTEAALNEPQEDLTLSRKNSKKVKKNRKGSTKDDLQGSSEMGTPVDSSSVPLIEKIHTSSPTEQVTEHDILEKTPEEDIVVARDPPNEEPAKQSSLSRKTSKKNKKNRKGSTKEILQEYAEAPSTSDSSPAPLVEAIHTSLPEHPSETENLEKVSEQGFSVPTEATIAEPAEESLPSKEIAKKESIFDPEEASEIPGPLEMSSAPSHETIQTSPPVEQSLEHGVLEKAPEQILETPKEPHVDAPIEEPLDKRAPVNKSKKDKKKKDSAKLGREEPSGPSTPLEAVTKPLEEAHTSLPAEKSTEDIPELKPSDSTFIPEGLPASLGEAVHISLPAEQPVEKSIIKQEPNVFNTPAEANGDPFEEWAANKQSKKDKKKRKDSTKLDLNETTGPSTPLEFVPEPSVEVVHTSVPAVEPANKSILEDTLTPDVFTTPSETNEEGFEESKPTKKSKNDKNKRKDSVKFNSEELAESSTPQPPLEAVETSSSPVAHTEKETLEQGPELPLSQDILVNQPNDEPSEVWGTTKKSKKDKKKRQDSVPIDFAPQPGLSTPSVDISEHKDILPASDVQDAIPEDISKKEKTLEETASQIDRTQEFSQQPEDLREDASKLNDKRVPKSGLSTPIEGVVAASALAGALAVGAMHSTTVSSSKDVDLEICDEETVPTEPKPEDECVPASTKKPKKDKKKRESGPSTQFEGVIEPPQRLSTESEQLNRDIPQTSQEPGDVKNQQSKAVVEETHQESADDWSSSPTEMSKKDKKKQKSGLSTSSLEISEPSHAILDDSEQLNKDVLQASTGPEKVLMDEKQNVAVVEEEKFSPPANERASPSTKKSKSDKKKNRPSTSFEGAPDPVPFQSLAKTSGKSLETPGPPLDVLSESLPSEETKEIAAIVHDDIADSTAARKSKEKRNQKSEIPTPVEEIRESLLEPSFKPTEEIAVEPQEPSSREVDNVGAPLNSLGNTDKLDSIPAKKSKKDKKRKSGLSTLVGAILPEVQPDVLEEPSQPLASDNTVGDMEYTEEPLQIETANEGLTKQIVNQPEDGLEADSSKKSKDKKKKRKSGIAPPAQPPPEPEKPTFDNDKQTSTSMERSLNVEEPSKESSGMAPTTVIENKETAHESTDGLSGTLETKNSKKDKKTRKSTVSKPIESLPIERESTFPDNSTEPIPRPGPIDLFHANKSPFVTVHQDTEVRGQAATEEVNLPEEKSPESTVQGTHSPEFPVEAKDDDATKDAFAFVTKRSKKEKKGKQASKIALESEPGTSTPIVEPLLVEKAEVSLAEGIAPVDRSFLAEAEARSKGPETPSSTSKNTDILNTDKKPGLEEVEAISTSRKGSKKDKRKRQATIDPSTNEPFAPPPLTSWADDIEEAQVVRNLPVIEEIANDESLSHIPITSPTDDFVRPSKKGKKNKKNDLTTELHDVTHPSNSSDTPAKAFKDKMSNTPIVAAAGTAAAATAVLLSKAGDSSTASVAAPAQKLSKKEKRKMSIDKRAPKEDMFDDPALWEGANPTVYEETKGDGDGAGSDGFWSAPQEDTTEVSARRGQDPIPETHLHDVPASVNTHAETIRDLSPPPPSIAEPRAHPAVEKLVPEPSLGIAPKTPSRNIESSSYDQSFDQYDDTPGRISVEPSGKDTREENPTTSEAVNPEESIESRNFSSITTATFTGPPQSVLENMSTSKGIPFDESTQPPINQEHISTSPGEANQQDSFQRRAFSPGFGRHSPTGARIVTPRSSRPRLSDLAIVPEENITQTEIKHHPSHHEHLGEANRDSGFLIDSPISHQKGFTDHYEHVRDSGVHLRDESPTARGRAPVSSTDDALARLSWPTVDEDTETVNLHHSQRTVSDTHKKHRHEEEKTPDAHDPKRSKSARVSDFYRSQREKAQSPILGREEKSLSNRDLLPSQMKKDVPDNDLHTTPTIHGRKPGENNLVKQDLQNFDSPDLPKPSVSKTEDQDTVVRKLDLRKDDLQRSQSPKLNLSQTPKLDRYAELNSSPIPKSEKPKGISEIEAAGVAIAGAPLGFAAARKFSQDSRPDSAEGQKASPNINRLRTPDIKRTESAASNRSATPPLRRSDRQLSGDLRSLSQRSKPDLAKEAELAAISASSFNTTNPTANEGRVRAKDMADVYDGFGEGRMGSPRSPTRPHSMRRRQSMQVLDLESKVEQLAAENRMLAEAKAQAERTLMSTQHSSSSLIEKDAEIDSLKRTLEWLQNEVSRLTEVNTGLTSANVVIARQHSERYGILESQHAAVARDLQETRDAHNNLAAGMDEIVKNEVQTAVLEKDRVIAQLRAELDTAKEKIREMQREMLATKGSEIDFLTIRDEDYFDNACQQLCQHVQQWVLRFSKFSDMRACRLTSEINNDKIIDRLDNAILDGSDVDSYLADRVKRRDVFMSMTMTMVWEFVFTRYLFGMDREQRQKLKSLEKILSEVGPQAAVHQWRATTLTLLAKREAFAQQREQDTEAVVHAILETLSEILPPPSNLEAQIEEQLMKVMKVAVNLSIEMRTQRAEYMMLPPLQPEYDANGDLASKVSFNAALMNERSGDTISNEDLEAQKAIVRIVLFPLVVKKGDDRGEGDEEIVVCPAQVLVAKPKKARFMDGTNHSRVSMQSSMPPVDDIVI